MVHLIKPIGITYLSALWIGKIDSKLILKTPSIKSAIGYLLGIENSYTKLVMRNEINNKPKTQISNRDAMGH